MTWFAVRGSRFAIVLFLCASCATTRKPMFDLKITNGRIVDGTGAPWYRGDIGIRGDTIVTIGDLSHTTAASTLDARDQIVAPGFIDLLGQSQSSVLTDPHLEAKIRQGVTTEVTGEGRLDRQTFSGKAPYAVAQAAAAAGIRAKRRSS